MKKQNVNLKEMTRKQRMSYFWDYYRYHVIVAGFMVVFIGSVFFEMRHQPDILLNLVLSQPVNETTDWTDLEKELTTSYHASDIRHETVKIFAYPFWQVENHYNELTQVYLEKFIAQLAASELDVFILNRDDFSYFFEQGIFQPLDETDLLNQVDDNKHFIATDGKTYGIQLAGNAILESYGIDTSDLIMTMFSNTLRQEESLEFMLTIYKQK